MPPMNESQWRSLAEFAASPESRSERVREFPPLASEWPGDVSRRDFLRLMGASLTLAGLSGCTRQPLEKIVPYVRQPEELVPGQPLYFATALTLEGYARGVLVESHEGRPTKIEGNPQHPASLGASDVFMQAELLQLYDPDRSKTVMRGKEVSTWDEFLAVVADKRRQWLANRGEGLRLLTGQISSPTLIDQIAGLLKQFPAARWHVHEPLASLSPKPFYDIAKADVIVSLAEDFLGAGPAQLRYVRDFSRRRRVEGNSSNLNRLYVAESTPTITGAMADHRFVLAPSALRAFGMAVAAGKGPSKWNPVLQDFRAHPGQSLVLTGDSLPNELHEFARSWNQPLQIAEPIISAADSLGNLIQDIERGQVQALVILGANPVYTAPVDFKFRKKLTAIPFRIRCGLYEDETSALCQWHVPETHSLEAWSDARAFDGTATIMQPLIQPLYAGKSAHEFIAALTGSATDDGYEILRKFWQQQYQENDFEKFWRKSLHDGVVPQDAVKLPVARSALSEKVAQPVESKSGIELLLLPDPHIRDGRFANNAWLQELPKPFTKITWDNAALISPATAKRLDVANGQEVELNYRGRSVRAPAWILPGQADDCVTVHLGYGRTHAGRAGTGLGFNAYPLRAADAPWGGPGLEIVRTGGNHSLATTQQHHSMEGRGFVRHGTLALFQQNPRAIVKTEEASPAPGESLYPPVEYKDHAWGMVINLSACVGCNVCTIACQAENNIPVVGREQVARGREMHWIRVDNYFEDAPERPRFHFQPVPCMHCENAPCELVCPVGATVHSAEGINQMVYNRCIGTRYCSNNCPYKVRRFNFLEYDRNRFEEPAILTLLRNPDVSVRTRGVMEKCTYCIQRINRARIQSENENRPIRDGEIIPACAQACPAEAIAFGDINDAQSRVARLKSSPLNYGLLAELNTRPRTTYLAKLRNPNPEVEET